MFTTLRRTSTVLSRGSAKRHAGGWLSKNIYCEENAGLRELSYKTWNPTQNNSAWKLFGFIFVPSVVAYYFIVQENDMKNEKAGRNIDYGVLPPPCATLDDKHH